MAVTIVESVGDARARLSAARCGEKPGGADRGGTAAGGTDPGVDGGTEAGDGGIDGGTSPRVDSPVDAIWVTAGAAAGTSTGDEESPDAGSIAMALDAIDVKKHAAAEADGGGSERAADRPT
jgi:hypothetical protein